MTSRNWTENSIYLGCFGDLIICCRWSGHLLINMFPSSRKHIPAPSVNLLCLSRKRIAKMEGAHLYLYF